MLGDWEPSVLGDTSEAVAAGDEADELTSTDDCFSISNGTEIDESEVASAPPEEAGAMASDALFELDGVDA